LRSTSVSPAAKLMMPIGPGSGPPISGPSVISSAPATICAIRIAGWRRKRARAGESVMAMRYG
jgi:hypothetical protein